MAEPHARIDIAFDTGWIVGADGDTWAERTGASCVVDLPRDVPPDTEFVCHLRIEARLSRPGGVVGLLITNHGTMIEERVLFGGLEHDVEIVLRAAPGARHRLGFEVADAAGADAAVGVRSISCRLRPRDRRAQDAVIGAGLAASLALFPRGVAESAWSNADDLARLVVGAIRARAPFSMIRLGDGEGRILSYPILMAEPEMETQTLRYMFGPPAIARLRAEDGALGTSRGLAMLRRLLLQAVQNADGVGLPAPVHFQRYAALPHGPARNALTDAMVGFAGALLAAARHLAVPAERLFDTYIFHRMQRAALFDGILSGLDYLGVLSHTDRSGEIGARFGIGTVEHLRVPAHHTFMPSDEVHFPDRYQDIVARIRVPFRGAPYLVAAGYLGKVYCDVIKAQGGIAIDIGSVFDGWFGVGRTAEAGNPEARLEWRPAAP